MVSQSLLYCPLIFALFDSIFAATITTSPPFPTSTPNGTCPTTQACYFTYPHASSLEWVTIVASTTVVAATVSVHCNSNRSSEACTTTTIFNRLPVGIELPPTNSAGTRTAVVTSFDGKVTDVAYPTRWADYDTLVSWSGTLSTKGVCSTEKGAVITLPAHTTVTLDQQITIDSTDPKGFFYSPTMLPFLASDMAKQRPDELALQSCSPTVPFPLVAASGVHFLTETTTDFGSGEATQTAEPAKPSSQAPVPSSKAEQPPAPTATPPRPSVSAVPVQGPAPSSSNGLGGLISAIASMVTQLQPSNAGATGRPLPPVSVVAPGQPSAAPGKPETPATTQGLVITFDNNPITASSSSVFVIGTQTLAPGNTITVSGTTIALGPSASFIVVNGETSTLTPATVTPPSVVIGGQTLTAGGTITLDGTTVALGPSASFIVVNGATSTLQNPVASVTPPPLTVGGTVITAAPGTGTNYIVSGQTLTPGGTITVNGSVISLPASGTPSAAAETGSSSAAFFSKISASPSPSTTTAQQPNQSSTARPSPTGTAGQGAGSRLQAWSAGCIALVLGQVMRMFV